MKLTSKERRTLAKSAPPELQAKLLRRPGRPPLDVDWTRARKLLAKGLSYRRIAAELGVSAASVSVRLKGLGRKPGRPKKR